MKRTLLLLLPILVSCGSGDTPPPSAEGRFLFSMRSDNTSVQDFVASTTSPEMIAKVRNELKKPLAERSLMINGKIERGNGGNKNWSWHFVSDNWDIVEVSAEVCDGSPSFVEQDIDYWVDTVQRFCPWASFVKQELTQEVQ